MLRQANPYRIRNRVIMVASKSRPQLYQFRAAACIWHGSSGENYLDVFSWRLCQRRQRGYTERPT